MIIWKVINGSLKDVRFIPYLMLVWSADQTQKRSMSIIVTTTSYIMRLPGPAFLYARIATN